MQGPEVVRFPCDIAADGRKERRINIRKTGRDCVSFALELIYSGVSMPGLLGESLFFFLHIWLSWSFVRVNDITSGICFQPICLGGKE